MEDYRRCKDAKALALTSICLTLNPYSGYLITDSCSESSPRGLVKVRPAGFGNRKWYTDASPTNLTGNQGKLDFCRYLMSFGWDISSKVLKRKKKHMLMLLHVVGLLAVTDKKTIMRESWLNIWPAIHNGGPSLRYETLYYYDCDSVRNLGPKSQNLTAAINRHRWTTSWRCLSAWLVAFLACCNASIHQAFITQSDMHQT